MVMNYSGYNNYGYNIPQPQPNYFNQPQNFNATFVSDIAEAVATKPDVTGKPLFFYNKASEEVYIKQYDNTGNAPVKTYKLIVPENIAINNNSYIENFKSLNNKLDDIKKLLTPDIIEKGNKKNERGT